MAKLWIILGVVALSCRYDTLATSIPDCAQYYTVRSMLRCFDTSSQEGGEEMMACMRRRCAERQSIERQRRQHVSVCRQSCSTFFHQDHTANRLQEELLVHVPNSCQDWCQSEEARNTGYEFRAATVSNIRVTAYRQHQAHQTA